ncbi:MAG: hypothetical protein J7M40_02035 [Planctomycetes bacterium]|nr:hypothetical protein [Planctomycetota bacterium]
MPRSKAHLVKTEKLTYPNSREVYYNYASSGPGEALSRLENIAASADPGSSQKHAVYTYLGANTIVKVAHPAEIEQDLCGVLKDGYER